MNENNIHELAKQIAALEERMNTKQAEYKTDIARLAEQIAKRDNILAEQYAQLEKKLAERDTRLAERDSRFILLFVSLIVGATAFLSLMIKL